MLYIQPLDNLILLSIELVINLRMLILLVLIVCQFTVMMLGLTFDISMSVLVILFEHLVSGDQ